MNTLDRLAALADKSNDQNAGFKLYAVAGSYLSILAVEMNLQPGFFRITNESDGVALRTHGVIVKVTRARHLCRVLVSGMLDGRRVVETLETDCFNDMEALARFVRRRIPQQLKRAA